MELTASKERLCPVDNNQNARSFIASRQVKLRIGTLSSVVVWPSFDRNRRRLSLYQRVGGG